MKRVIINADDFGMTRGCTEGIIKAMMEGIVTSTSVMINMDGALQSITFAKENGIEAIGLHLTLTAGKPVTETEKIGSLVQENSRFHKRSKALLSKIKLEEVRIELEKQVEVFLKTGMGLTHLDSHHHIHMYDGVREVVGGLAKKYGVPLRHPDHRTKKYLLNNNIVTTDYFSMDFYGEGANLENLIRIIEEFPRGTIEIMTHPAFLDDELMKMSNYNNDRERELEILTGNEIKKWLESSDVRLISFKELRDENEILSS